MPRKGLPDSTFGAHFRKLVRERGKQPRDFHKHGTHRISRNAYYDMARGYHPSDEIATRVAYILGCSRADLLHPPRHRDWLRPDVAQFLGPNDLLAIDSAIVIHRGPELHAGRQAWRDDSLIELKISGRAVTRRDLRSFGRIIDDWQARNRSEMRGIKYCVQEINAQTAEGGGKLSLSVRPIEYHLSKPICDHLAGSYHGCREDNAFLSGPDASFRRDHFAQLADRNHPPQPNVLCAHLLVLSKDDKALLLRRRQQGLGYNRGCWSASCEEHYNADWKQYLPKHTIYPPSSTPDPTVFAGLRRALREELKLASEIIHNSEISVLAVGMEFENHVVNIYALACIPRTAEQILSHSGLRSNEEHDCLAFCHFDLPTLLPVLLDRRSSPKDVFYTKNVGATPGEWRWHPTSRMRLYLGLVHRFGEAAVEVGLTG